MSEPTLTEIIKMGIKRELANVHTAMPGLVESYDATARLAKVKPCLRRLYSGDDQAIDLPMIINVPVIQPRTLNAQISMPVSAGDYVLLVFCERSIDRWLELGSTVDPQDPAMHALNDAVAIPGLFPKGKPLALNGNKNSLEVANGNSFIEIERDGKIKIETSGNITLDASQVNIGDESGSALALKSDLDLMIITAPSGGGPCIINTAACVGTLKTRAS